jgi:hypothetical protein
MKYSILLFLTLLSILFSCVNPKNSTVYHSVTDTVYVYDTIKVYDTITLSHEVYLKSLKLYEEEYRTFYSIVKSGTPNKHFVNQLDKLIYPRTIMVGSMFNEKIINEGIVLFFLKVYHNNLNGDGYLFNVSCCLDNNIYIMLFTMQYCKISGKDPSWSFMSPMVYEWVKNQPEYLKNKDIKKEVDEIKALLDKGVKPKEY